MAAPYFALTAANGKIIGTCALYATAAARNTGMVWVKANAPAANTVA
ncbi:DUF1508 domain-containing protein [Polaromonas sp. JS666]